jgi:hypothetical protein
MAGFGWNAQGSAAENVLRGRRCNARPSACNVAVKTKIARVSISATFVRRLDA